MSNICYRYLRHYKYQLLEDFSIDLDFAPMNNVEISDFVFFRNDGNLLIKARYAWDGPSGPTLDTKTFMRGSLIHDALYQLIREGKLDPKFRRDADDLLKENCKEDGMCSFRAWYVHKAVTWFGKIAVQELQKYKKKMYAPKPPMDTPS